MNYRLVYECMGEVTYILEVKYGNFQVLFVQFIFSVDKLIGNAMPTLFFKLKVKYFSQIYHNSIL